MAAAGRLGYGQVVVGNGGVSNGAQRVAGIRVKRQAVVPITSAVAGVGNRVGYGQYVSGKGDNHNDIKEVIHKNNNHHEFPVITGRLEQAVNRH